MTERHAIEGLTLSDGRVLKLVGDMNALCDFERVMNAAGFDATRELERFENGGGGFSVTRALFWAFAQEHHPDLTLRECGSIIQAEGKKLVDALASTMDRAMPPPSEGADGAPAGVSPGKTPPQKA